MDNHFLHKINIIHLKFTSSINHAPQTPIFWLKAAPEVECFLLGALLPHTTDNTAQNAFIHFSKSSMLNRFLYKNEFLFTFK